MTDAAVTEPVRAFLDKAIADNRVILFMKGSPDQPRCGFSGLVVQVLDHLNVPFVGVDVLQEDDLRDGIKAYSDWPTIPQLYVDGEFVGGADIVKEMFQSGELKTLFDGKGIAAA